MFWAPERTLRELFALIADDTGGVDGVRDVPAGDLGGVMRCGTTATPGGSMSVCGWADHGSAAVALFPSRAMDESATLLLSMRDAMHHRD